MSGSCDKGGSMIFDTDVPICFLRGDSRAARLSGIRLVPVSESMSDVSLSLIEAYAPGKVLGVSDALIAATARDVAQPLATGNARHFKVIAGLEVKVFRPGAA
jgi:predicted nucleic acid-binding protein